jgi:HlyD family secretion protein
VDVGQTVAASLSAPTLFVIAEDLKKMKIMAQVDETDIGKIKTSQEVRFSVQAYPDKKYAGTVSQVRLQPEVLQNVVTYTVVILADNNDGTLLPGMTANVEFLEAREANALTVPASVFRFQPPKEAQDMLEKMMKERKAGKEARGNGDGGMTADGGGDGMMMAAMKNDGISASLNDRVSAPLNDRISAPLNDRISAPLNDRGQGGGQFNKNGERRKDGGERRGGKRPQAGATGSRGVIWTLDENGAFKPVFVKIGLSDGVTTVVTGKDDLTEGLKVVVGEARSDKDKKQSDKKKPQNPLMPQRGGGPRRM